MSPVDRTDPTASITVRTPHADLLAETLGARDLTFRFTGPDTLVVIGMAADDLGWLAAGAGVVVYAMVAGEQPPDG